MSERTVHVVDDDEAVRDSIRWLLQSVGMQVETYSSAEELLSEPPTEGCLLVDLRLGGLSGLELHAHLAQRGVRIPVIMISAHAEIPLAVRAMKAGVLDFLEKPFGDSDLIAALNNAFAKGEELRRAESERAHARKRLEELTPRERQVFERVASGKSNKVVAKELGLSSKTVEYHRGRLMNKLKIPSLAALVQLALAARDGDPLRDAEDPEKK